MELILNSNSRVVQSVPAGRWLRSVARTIVYACLLTVLAGGAEFISPRIAFSQSNQTRLTVNARIATYFQLEVGFQSPVLVLTEADIARGYVDVDAGTAFTVKTNTFEPYVVDFLPVSSMLSAVVIGGVGPPARIGPDGGAVVYRVPHGRIVDHQLSYRFMLNKEIRPGTYPWPLRISVRMA